MAWAPEGELTLESSIEHDMQPENSWDPSSENPDNEVGWRKRIKFWFWKLFPLDPIL